jgi:hypothetical protein
MASHRAIQGLSSQFGWLLEERRSIIGGLLILNCS